MAKEFNEANFKTEVLDFQGSALVDFWAPWCGPCRAMGPVIDSLTQKYEGKIKIGKVNVDDNQGLAGQYGIMSIPSILFFKGGKLVYTHLGATSEADLEGMVKQYLS